MKPGTSSRWRWIGGLEFLSPKGLVLRAGFLVLFYALCGLAGLREYTTFLSGTTASGLWSASVIWGVTYLVAYFGFVLLVPILLLAAALQQLWLRGVRARRPGAPH